MQIEKLSKELKAIRKIKSMSTDRSIKRCKQLQMYGRADWKKIKTSSGRFDMRWQDHQSKQ